LRLLLNVMDILAESSWLGELGTGLERSRQLALGVEAVFIASLNITFRTLNRLSSPRVLNAVQKDMPSGSMGQRRKGSVIL
jgi:hypothetical protein